MLACYGQAFSFLRHSATHLALPSHVVEDVVDGFLGVVPRDMALLISSCRLSQSAADFGVSQQLAVRGQRLIWSTEMQVVHLRHLLERLEAPESELAAAAE
jgi:hypothetical protein